MKTYVIIQCSTWKARIQGPPGTEGVEQLGDVFCGKQTSEINWAVNVGSDLTPMSSGRAHTLMTPIFGFPLISHLPTFPSSPSTTQIQVDFLQSTRGPKSKPMYKAHSVTVLSFTYSNSFNPHNNL